MKWNKTSHRCFKSSYILPISASSPSANHSPPLTAPILVVFTKPNMSSSANPVHRHLTNAFLNRFAPHWPPCFHLTSTHWHMAFTHRPDTIPFRGCQLPLGFLLCFWFLLGVFVFTCCVLWVIIFLCQCGSLFPMVVVDSKQVKVLACFI